MRDCDQNLVICSCVAVVSGHVSTEHKCFLSVKSCVGPLSALEKCEKHLLAAHASPGLLLIVFLKCYYKLWKNVVLVLCRFRFYIWQKCAMPIIVAKFQKQVWLFNYDFSFKLSAIIYQILFQSSCIERAGSREKVTSSTYEFNFSMCEPI